LALMPDQKLEDIERASANAQGNAVFEDVPQFQGHGSLTDTDHLVHTFL
jgi:hypothetical protein